MSKSKSIADTYYMVTRNYGMEVAGIDQEVMDASSGDERLYKGTAFKWHQVTPGEPVPSVFVLPEIIDLYVISVLLGATVGFNRGTGEAEAMATLLGLNDLFSRTEVGIADIDVKRVKVYPTGHADTTYKGINLKDWELLKSNPLVNQITGVGNGMSDEGMAVMSQELHPSLLKRWGVPLTH